MATLALRAPVIFLVFNRPGLTARVLERIREARPSRLFLVADGPRPDRTSEAERCAEVRRLVENGIDWPCELVRDYAETNLGCARRVSSGITNAFEQTEEAIILEDDCLPDPTFFQFCDELLERYCDEERVGQIAGCSFIPQGREELRESYYFSRYPHCWGWATWRRAWRHYDHEMAAWESSREASWALPLERQRERAIWADSFDSVARGTLDSWAYRWTLSLWANGLLSINSAGNLVTNLGYGVDATHTTTGHLGHLPLEPIRFPLVHPGSLIRNEKADAVIGKTVFEPPSIPRRILRLLGGRSR